MSTYWPFNRDFQIPSTEELFEECATHDVLISSLLTMEDCERFGELFRGLLEALPRGINPQALECYLPSSLTNGGFEMRSLVAYSRSNHGPKDLEGELGCIFVRPAETRDWDDWAARLVTKLDDVPVSAEDTDDLRAAGWRAPGTYARAEAGGHPRFWWQQDAWAPPPDVIERVLGKPPGRRMVVARPALVAEAHALWIAQRSRDAWNNGRSADDALYEAWHSDTHNGRFDEDRAIYGRAQELRALDDGRLAEIARDVRHSRYNEARAHVWAQANPRANPDGEPRARRVVNRPRPLPAILEDIAAGDEIDADEIPPRAPAGPRRRTKGHTKDLDATTILAAAAGEAGPLKQVANHYHRYVRKMAFAFLKAWSPSASPKHVGDAADEITADVEQRVFSGTPKSSQSKGSEPSIKHFHVGKGRTRPGRHGFGAGEQTSAGADKAAAFSTWLAAVVRNRARAYVEKEVRAARGAKAGAPDVTDDIALSFEDEMLQKEELQKLRATSAAQSSQMVDALATLQASPTRTTKDELEVLRLRQKGESYKEMAATLGISVSAVMSRLFRARRSLEKASGLELRGLVGELRDGLGGAVPSARGRPRHNPEAPGADGVVVYFEDIGDVFDLWDEGVFDDDSAVAALEALAEYRPDAV